MKKVSTYIEYRAYLLLIVLLLMAMLFNAAHAATIQSASSGYWSSTGTWVGGSIPASTDSVVINSQHNVQVNGDHTCAGIGIIVNDFEIARLIINPGYTLTVNGNATIQGGFIGTSQIIVRGTMDVNGDINFDAPDAATDAAILMSYDNSTLYISGNMNLVNLGSISNSSTKKSNIIFDGSSAQTLETNGNFKYHDITIDNSSLTGVTLNGNLSASLLIGNLTVESGMFNNGGYSITGNDSTFTVKNGATFHMTGTNGMPGSMIHVLETGSAVEFAGSDQTIDASTYHDMALSGSGTKILGGNIDVNGDLTIGSGIILDASSGNDYDINVGGNWSNSGTFTARNGTVVFDGSSSQTITSGSSLFYDVTFNNAGGFSLSGAMTISNVATMTSGVITTGSDYLALTSATAANLTGFSNTSFVNGNLRRNIASNTDTYSFPVGNGTATTNYYRTDLINGNMTGVTYIDASFGSLTGHDDNDIDVSDDYITYNTVRSEGVWTIEPDAQPSGGDYDIRLYLENFNTGALTDDQFAMMKRPSGSMSGADWTASGDLNPNGGDGRLVAHGYALRMNITSFSEFGIGGGDPASSLPIELLSFDAKYEDGAVQLNWVTATEIDNDYFTVERSVDGHEFESIATIDGAGNSLAEKTYYSKDDNPLKGISYYRLKQTDFNGTYSYSNIRIINTESSDATFSVMPNPVNEGQSFSVFVAAPNRNMTDEVNIIEAVSGKIVQTHSLSEGGRFIAPNDLPRGLYIVRGVIGNEMFSEKLIVQ